MPFESEALFQERESFFCQRLKFLHGRIHCGG